MSHQFGNLCYHIEKICEKRDPCFQGRGGVMLEENVWWKMSGEIVGGGGGGGGGGEGEEYRDSKNQFSFIRKT